MLTEEIKTELVHGLVTMFGGNVQEIILYGSVARDEATDESDVDIAVILKKEFDEKARRRFVAWAAELDLKYDKVFSVVDIEQERYQKWKSSLPFYRNISEEGIVLWKTA